MLHTTCNTIFLGTCAHATHYLQHYFSRDCSGNACDSGNGVMPIAPKTSCTYRAKPCTQQCSIDGQKGLAEQNGAKPRSFSTIPRKSESTFEGGSWSWNLQIPLAGPQEIIFARPEPKTKVERHRVWCIGGATNVCVNCNELSDITTPNDSTICTQEFCGNWGKLPRKPIFAAIGSSAKGDFPPDHRAGRIQAKIEKNIGISWKQW